MLKASCSCGQLSLTVEAEPLRVSVCHCHACQKRTGSAFGVQARFPAQSMTAKGHCKSYQRIGDAGSTISHYFCPESGNSLWFTVDSMMDVVAIPLGNFAEDTASLDDIMSPQVSVYQARCHAWLKLEGINEIYD